MFKHESYLVIPVSLTVLTSFAIYSLINYAPLDSLTEIILVTVKHAPTWLKILPDILSILFFFTMLYIPVQEYRSRGRARALIALAIVAAALTTYNLMLSFAVDANSVLIIDAISKYNHPEFLVSLIIFLMPCMILRAIALNFVKRLLETC